MKITAVSAQQKNPNRVNVSVDGRYRFSLDLYQVIDLGIRVGMEFSKEELSSLEEESLFGKLYARALEYCLVRPRASREVHEYLYRKTRERLMKTRSGQVVRREGVSELLAARVFERLTQKGYIDDATFARYWVENRQLKRGVSRRKLEVELRAKGVDSSIVGEVLSSSARSNQEEIHKVLARKRRQYPDEQKLMQYLARQGFGYDEITEALNADEE